MMISALMLSSLDAYWLKVVPYIRHLISDSCSVNVKLSHHCYSIFPSANLETTPSTTPTATLTSSTYIRAPTSTLLQLPQVITSSSLGSQPRSSLDPTSIGQIASSSPVTSPTPVSTRAGASTLSLSVSVSVVVPLVAAGLLIAGITAVIVFRRLRQRKQKNTGNSTDDVYFTVENQTLYGQWVYIPV